MLLPAEIAGQSITTGAPMRVVAEIGLNHNGDPDLAHRIVEGCAEAGVWAVKFQVFEARELLVARAPAPAHVEASSLRDFFGSFQLPADAYPGLVRHARDRGLAVVATAFDDPRLTLLHADAAVYLKENASRKFDVVIVDSSDPVGPAEVLYRSEFYESMKKSLSHDGVICTQGECLWLHLDLIVDVMQRCHALFPSVNYSYTTIPTYPSGQIGFIMCSLDESDGVLAKPKRTPDDKMQQTLRYYNAKIHEASFVLPSFAERKIATVRK